MKIFTLKRASCGGRQCGSELPRHPPTVYKEIYVEFSRNVVRLISTAESFTRLYIGDPHFPSNPFIEDDKQLHIPASSPWGN